MKTTIYLTLLLFGFLTSNAQNGGQFFNNNVIRIHYMGYSSGTHTFKVVNKQNCDVRIRTKADNDPAVDISVPGSDSFYVNVFRGNPDNVKFRVKAETSCPSFTNPDMGWLELNTSGFILNLVIGNEISFVRGPNILELSINGGIYKSKYGLQNYSESIFIYDMMGLSRHRYNSNLIKQNRLDLNPYLIKGINLVYVIIETNYRKEIFLFRIIN